MKPFYFFVVLLSFCASAFAQREGASKIYGYKQKVLPGTVRVDATGRELPRKPRYNYFIYLASGSKVEPVEIWINGEVYSVISKEVKTPVEYSNQTVDGIKLQVLVPKTSRRVLQLGLSLNQIQKPTSKGKLVADKNELVVIYKCKDKLYYKTVSKLKDLGSVAMQ